MFVSKKVSVVRLLKLKERRKRRRSVKMLPLSMMLFPLMWKKLNKTIYGIANLSFGVKAMMNPIVKNAWDDDPPRLYIIAHPLPNAPHVRLSGGGMANMSLDSYLKKLQQDFDNKTGKYFAYVKGGCKEEADTFTLQTWDVYTSPTSCYEALIHLYYAPINEYLCLKKHLGEEWAQKYLDDVEKRQKALDAISEVLL